MFQSLDWFPTPTVSYLTFLITQDPVKKQLNSSPVKVSYLLTGYGTHWHPTMDGTRAFFRGDTASSHIAALLFIFLSNLIHRYLWAVLFPTLVQHWPFGLRLKCRASSQVTIYVTSFSFSSPEEARAVRLMKCTFLAKVIYHSGQVDEWVPAEWNLQDFEGHPYFW